MPSPQHSPPYPPLRQTTLLIGGSNGTATLCAILGDKSNPINAGHVLRVATRSSSKYLDPKEKNQPRTWRCEEKKHLSDVFSADVLPTRIVSHVGRPDSVFVYGDDENDNNNNDDDNDAISKSSTDNAGSPSHFDGDKGNNNGDSVNDDLTPLERAISGVGAPDNGGIIDLLVLCCPVSAHLSLLRRIARALYRLDSKGLLGNAESHSGGSFSRPPILIGTLYGAGGFDWMSRIAFSLERPPQFPGKFKRSLALFGLKAFPFLCKSLEAGKVTLHGRFPQLQVAVSPSNAVVRGHTKVLLDRLLQNETTGKTLEFLGLGSKEDLGGDGTCMDEFQLMGQQGTISFFNQVSPKPIMAKHAVNATSAMLLAAETHKQIKNATSKVSTAVASSAASYASSIPLPSFVPSSSAMYSNNHPKNPPQSPVLDLLTTQPLSDHADPSSSLAFLACTLNSTNLILHPCILVALFNDPLHPERSGRDGTRPWNLKKESTPLPRFYADGAAKPMAGKLITAIAGGEMYFVMDALERLLCPRGMEPITALHGGEPVGRKFMNFLGNSPRELGERSGLTEKALQWEWRSMFGNVHDGNNVDVGNTVGEGDGSERAGNKKGWIHREKMLAFLMSLGLSRNSRLGAVLSPCIVVQNSSSENNDGTILIKPNPTTRFFTDDVQHGLCIYLGLAELLGFDLERDMPQTLYVVRRLQRWMGKEFILPEEKAKKNTKNQKIVAHGKDMAETSAPQAFGIKSIQELKQFLQLDVFGETHNVRAEDRLMKSALVSRL